MTRSTQSHTEEEMTENTKEDNNTQKEQKESFKTYMYNISNIPQETENFLSSKCKLYEKF